MCFRRLLCVRIEIDQLQCVNCWVIIHCLSVSCTTINHSRCALVIWSSLQLTSKQWIITQQFTAGADLFLNYTVLLEKNYLLTPPQGRGCVVRLNMCLHSALCSFPIDLICHMTTFRKKCFGLWSHPRGRGCVWGQNMCFMLLHSSFPLIWCTTWPCSEKVEFLAFDPVPRSKRGSIDKNICYHVDICVIPFNFIRNMTIFWKCEFCPLPHRLSTPRVHT